MKSAGIQHRWLIPSEAGDGLPATAREIGVFTLMLWLTCLFLGGLGLALPYPRPHPPQREESVQAQPLQVELTQEPLPAPDPATPAALPPALPDLLQPPPLPQPPIVAPPDPAIAFALPLEGPTRIGTANSADRTLSQTPSASPAALPPAQKLTFGEGDGRQPAPEYPRESVRQGQEGVVVVRLAVDASGRVQLAEAASPSPWPLLDAAALRTVRERWRFPRGPLRRYEVPIRFELTQ